jgi:hypothetical protein
MPEIAQQAGNAEVLTGRIAEYQELLDVLEQRGLTGQHREVPDAPSAIGCHHRQIAKNPAGVVT